MVLIILGIVLNALVLCVFRTIVLSRHSSKLMDSMVWRLDMSRWLYPAVGIVFSVSTYIEEGMSNGELMFFCVVWTLCALVLWFLPPRIARFI